MRFDSGRFGWPWRWRCWFLSNDWFRHTDRRGFTVQWTADLRMMIVNIWHKQTTKTGALSCEISETYELRLIQTDAIRVAQVLRIVGIVAALLQFLQHHRAAANVHACTVPAVGTEAVVRVTRLLAGRILRRRSWRCRRRCWRGWRWRCRLWRFVHRILATNLFVWKLHIFEMIVCESWQVK